MYPLVKPFLFLLSAERAHYFTTGSLAFLFIIPGVKWLFRKAFTYAHPDLECEVAGIKFKNPIGLAAGFDKDAKFLNRMSVLGFGFIEIGTVTPLSQPGNDKPRLFRLKQDHALINRMGFNNDGVHAAAARLSRFKKNGLIIGGNIGKNKVTPNEEAYMDYRKCAEALYEHIDYFVVNVSSPNTPGLRELQGKDELAKILDTVIRSMNGKTRKPVFLKIAPDLTDDQIHDIVTVVKEQGVEGVIATNTTIDRSGLKTSDAEIEKIGNGGLSGRPVTQRSTEVIRLLREKAGTDMAIIGVGGIHGPEDAKEKLEAGADLVQVYTGLIYEGPGLVSRIAQSLVKK